MKVDIEKPHGRYVWTGIANVDDKKIHLKLQSFVFKWNFAETFRYLHALWTWMIMLEYKDTIDCWIYLFLNPMAYCGSQSNVA